jgi:hypothetical protein
MRGSNAKVEVEVGVEAEARNDNDVSNVPDLEVYDLHILRQRGANAASFCEHQDIHDTGDASTTEVATAVSLLLGGWRF